MDLRLQRIYSCRAFLAVPKLIMALWRGYIYSVSLFEPRILCCNLFTLFCLALDFHERSGRVLLAVVPLVCPARARRIYHVLV